MDNSYKKICETADYLKSRLDKVPDTAIVLGSGLGSLMDGVHNRKSLKYEEIPNYPISTVKGHEGMLISGSLAGHDVLAMKGRFHYYEGYDIQTTVFGIRVFAVMGIKNIILTNAAGGINTEFEPGDLMIINDHLGFYAPSVLRGPNIEELGTRFPDMSKAYAPELIELAKKSGAVCGVNTKEGVYAFTKGPMFETPAEIRALRMMGADAVGMSTVPEVIAANHAGLKVLGISCISNMAAGILEQPLTHDEVMETGKMVEEKFVKLVTEIVKEM